MKKKQNQTLWKSLLFAFAILLLIGVITKTGSISADAAKKAKKSRRYTTVVYDGATKTFIVKEKGVVLCTAPYKKQTVYAKTDLSYARKGPGRFYTKTRKLEKIAGDKLVRVASVMNKHWAIVRDGHGKYLFISNKYLSTKKPLAYMAKKLYCSAQLRFRGVIHWNGWRWTWYSQRRMPGRGLHIPGRRVDKNGYVCDKNGYICLASGRLRRGAVVKTPFGKKGKVYDSGCGRDTLDVYTNF